MEKLTDVEKLIVNIKAVGDKRRQLLNTEEARNIAAEQQKTATKELKQRVSTVRKLIEEHQKQQKREEEMSKHVGTSKIADNSGEFSGPSLGGGGSVTSSRADRLEAERLKRKTQRELEIEKQQIELDRQLAQDTKTRKFG